MSVRQKIIGSVILIGLFVVFLWGGNSEKTPAPEYAPSSAVAPAPVLVELFTSQGCSSCPPADRVLKRLADEAAQGEINVIALSYHVDYWNRLGWKDPYSKAEFSERQRQYAQVLADRRVYTPQMIIQGQSGHVGSREQEVRKAIGQARQQEARTQITASLQPIDAGSTTHRVQYQLSGKTTGVILQLALVAPSVENNVPRGENGGRHLEHSQVVLDLQTHDEPAAEGIISIDTQNPHDQQARKLVLFVQDAESWEVLGVTDMAIPPAE